MREILLKRLWNGIASIRDYVAEECCNEGVDISIKVEGEQGEMILSPYEIINRRVNITKSHKSKFEDKEYTLWDYKWSPEIIDSKVWLRIQLMGKEWYTKLEDDLKRDYMKQLSLFVGERRNSPTTIVYPERENTFKAFKLTPYSRTKLVIIGQD